MVICRQSFSEVTVQTNVHQRLSHPQIAQIIWETVIESLEQNALVQMSRQLRGVEERLKEIGSSLAVVAGSQELFFGSALNLTQRMGQAFVPIVYDNFGLPVDVSSPPTNPVGTPEETPLISFQVGEAGCEGFAWCAVTEGSEEVMRSSDE